LKDSLPRPSSFSPKEDRTGEFQLLAGHLLYGEEEDFVSLWKNQLCQQW